MPQGFYALLADNFRVVTTARINFWTHGTVIWSNTDPWIIQVDDIINIDFISEHKELHEVKKSKAVEEAGIWQVKYYLYYLQKRGVNGIKGKIDYPLLKKSVVVELTEKDIEILERIILEITEIKHTDIPPICENSKLCKKCAYFDLCII